VNNILASSNNITRQNDQDVTVKKTTG